MFAQLEHRSTKNDLLADFLEVRGIRWNAVASAQPRERTSSHLLLMTVAIMHKAIPRRQRRKRISIASFYQKPVFDLKEMHHTLCTSIAHEDQ